jgi:hypothetical protein
MFGIYQQIVAFLKARTRDEIAQISAHVLTPVLVLIWSFFGFFGSESISLERPATISELKTEIARDGGITPRRGFVLIAEPESSEYRILLGTGPSKFWSSLDVEAAKANLKRLVLDEGGFHVTSTTPFLDVNQPMTFVVEGELGGKIQVAGGTERSEDWRLVSRRSNSLVATVLATCFFAFGVSVALATGAPPVGGDKDGASQVGAEPDED